MVLRLHYIFVFLAVFCSNHLVAQDIAGSWTGILTTIGSKVDYEVLISSDLTGYAMTSFEINGKPSSGIKVIGIHQRARSFILTDGDLVFNDFNSPSRRVKLVALLTLRTGALTDTLVGTFVTKSLDFRSRGSNEFSGTVTLYRQQKSQISKLLAKLTELHLYGVAPPLVAMKQNSDSSALVPAEMDAKKAVVTGGPLATRQTTQQPTVGAAALSQNINADRIAPRKAAADLALRKTEILRTIPFYADSLVLTLYDNGIVDGDTVSVVLNESVIIPRQGLTESAYRVVIPIPHEIGDSLKLVMYAENLGSIPPNTGLLIIEDGAARYEVRFEGDLQKSSAIILLRKRGN